jgi:hypothetical protein
MFITVGLAAMLELNDCQAEPKPNKTNKHRGTAADSEQKNEDLFVKPNPAENH